MASTKLFTKTEVDLIKEAAIKEYKMKHEVNGIYDSFYHLMLRIKKIRQLNIIIGIFSSALIVYLKGWETLIYLFLSATVVITVISTFLGVFVKK